MIERLYWSLLSMVACLQGVILQDYTYQEKEGKRVGWNWSECGEKQKSEK